MRQRYSHRASKSFCKKRADDVILVILGDGYEGVHLADVFLDEEVLISPLSV